MVSFFLQAKKEANILVMVDKHLIFILIILVAHRWELIKCSLVPAVTSAIPNCKFWVSASAFIRLYSPKGTIH